MFARWKITSTSLALLVLAGCEKSSSSSTLEGPEYERARQLVLLDTAVNKAKKSLAAQVERASVRARVQSICEPRLLLEGATSSIRFDSCKAAPDFSFVEQLVTDGVCRKKEDVYYCGTDKLVDSMASIRDFKESRGVKAPDSEGSGDVDARAKATGPGTVTLTRDTTSGGADFNEDVDRVLTRLDAKFTECYRQTLKVVPDAAGDVALEVVLDNRGRVLDAKVLEDTVKGGVATCVRKRLKRGRFPAPKGGAKKFERTLSFQR